MIPWVQLGSAPVPGGQEQLRLKRRGDEFSIMLGSNELMNSRLSGSEEALARLAGAKIADRSRLTMLIGGLGMGFTLRAALSALSRDARLVVAELVPAVVAWARGPMTELFAGSLDDPRVEILEADVADLIVGDTFDAILLDVDNGPDGLSRSANDRLYDEAGLAAAHAALTQGGVFAVWSAHPDRAFGARLRRSGFAVEEVAVRARGKRGARHVIWLATRIR
ncbi:MAG: spermidine synthase [Hyphomicrobiales bacterium]|nr:spermidine synthase [Hyphomicrobiales bacterium]